MYLLVFVTLIIGMVGIYAQVVSLEAARIASSMTGLAKNMIIWHDAAVSMADSVISNGQFPNGSTPCSLTYTPPSGMGLTKCGTSGTGTVTDSAGNRNTLIGSSEPVHLPPDFKAATIQFFSVLYQDSTNSQNFVVTFLVKPTVSASNPAPGFLALPPSNNLISYTATDLLHQLSISNLSDYSYGTAKTGGSTSVLVSPGYQHGGSSNSFQYNLPIVGGAGIISTGAVAIVTST